MTSFNSTVPPAAMQGMHQQNSGANWGHHGQENGMMPSHGHMPPQGPPLPAAQQQLLSKAFQTLNLTTDEKKAVNLVFERQGKTAEAAQLSLNALTPVQRAAFQGAYHKLQMIAAHQPQQVPNQPGTAQPGVGQQQMATGFGTQGGVTAVNPMMQSGGQQPGVTAVNPTQTTSAPITGFNTVPFNSGVTNTGVMTSPFGVRGADQIQ